MKENLLFIFYLLNIKLLYKIIYFNNFFILNKYKFIKYIFSN